MKQDLSEQLDDEEESAAEMNEVKKKMEAEIGDLKQDVDDLESALKKVRQHYTKLGVNTLHPTLLMKLILSKRPCGEFGYTLPPNFWPPRVSVSHFPSFGFHLSYSFAFPAFRLVEALSISFPPSFFVDTYHSVSHLSSFFFFFFERP